MKRKAAPATRRRRIPTDLVLPPLFMRHARALAIARAARDAHRSECELDAVGRDACRANARAIKLAKWDLNRSREIA